MSGRRNTNPGDDPEVTGVVNFPGNLAAIFAMSRADQNRVLAGREGEPSGGYQADSDVPCPVAGCPYRISRIQNFEMGKVIWRHGPDTLAVSMNTWRRNVTTGIDWLNSLQHS